MQIHVYYSPSPNTYQLYEDEGEGYNYAKGIYSKRNIIFNPAKQEIEISKQEGTYQSAYKYLQIVLHGFDNAIKSIMYNEKPVISQTDSHPIINPLQYTGMVYDESYQKELEEKEKMITQISFVITNQTGPIKIKWK